MLTSWLGLSNHNRVVKLRIPSPLNDPCVAAEPLYLGIALSSVFGSILETWPYRTTRHSHLNQNQNHSDTQLLDVTFAQ